MRSLLIVFTLAVSSLAFAAEPADETTLFEGPVPGEVKYKRHKDTEMKTEAGTIQFVCKDAVYLRVKSGFVRTIDTRTYFISEATATQNGKKLAWILDAKGELKGTTEPLKMPVLPESVVTAATEKLYLYFSLERLQERIDQAVQENDAEALKQYKERADMLRERAEKIGADFRLQDEFKKVAKYIEEQQRLNKEKYEYLDTHMEKVEMNRIVDQEAKLKSEMERMRAIARWGDGNPVYHVTLIGRTALVSANSNSATAGIAMMSRAEMMYERDRLRISHAKKLLDKEKAAKLDEFSERVTASRDTRIKEVATLGNVLHGLPPAKEVLEQRSLASLLHQKEDYTQLNRVLNGRITSDKALVQQVNPFAVLNAISIAAQIPEKTRDQQAEKLFALSQEMLNAVKYVPKDPLYDADRADIMRTSAGLAILAGTLDSPDGSWRNASSAKAAYAVRLLNEAEKSIIDKDGQIREQKSIAQALAGRYSDALRTADEIKKSREKVVPFLISYSRLQSLNDKFKEGLDTLGDAIGQGYDDIGFVAKNEDFTNLRRNDSLFKTYTKPQFTIDWVQPKALAKTANVSRLEIINNSPFAITKIRVTLRLDLRGQPDKPVIKMVDIPRIDKTDKYVWENAFEEPVVRVYKIKISLDAAQGKYVTETPNRK